MNEAAYCWREEAGSSGPIEPTVVIPTFNERQNVAILVERLVVASRYATSGSVDPMSGFFLIERGASAAAMRNQSGQGFKILLDIFASSPQPLAFTELPFRFRRRDNGKSKLDTWSPGST